MATDADEAVDEAAVEVGFADTKRHSRFTTS